jgi:hypothetical protein
MPLSRLENFLKNVDGNVIYVNPTDLDATDSIENQGNSLTRPFKTIQRALLEASRFSYQVGQNNDKFDRTTIMLYPGVHEIDNRPGFNVVDNSGTAQFRDRLGNVQTLEQLTDTSNYDLESPDNVLYKYNSVEGGVIVPRGVSIAGYDVRKTKIRPKFVPDPTDLSVTTAAIFRLTGACHFYAMTFFDGDPQGSVYKNYTTNRFSPQFSHHKLTCFEYADGVNGVGIGVSSQTTDLQMYFHKIQKAFGDSSGRPIGDFPTTEDMQPALPEFEIVGPVKAEDVGIGTIIAGDGTNPSQTITVDTIQPHGLVVDSPIRVAGINTFPDIYNGNFVVSEVLSDNTFKYLASAAPSGANNGASPSLDGDEVVVADTDNVTGASPYIFHCSMRSAYGMSGLHADGSKASGFKSMLVSQFTGIGLQKDNNAFLVYNKTSGQYDTNETAADSEKPLYLNGDAIYRPSYKSAHIKTSNDGYIQAVSIFAVGFSEHFTTSEGGDMSITNSNSNFGAVALNAKGFKPAAFAKDNRGYITHIIPPENQFRKDISVEWEAINVTKTVADNNASKIYLDGFTDSSTPPVHVIAGYRIGARTDDLLHVSIAGVGTVTTPIRMLNPTASEEGDISVKEYEVGRSGSSNSISTSSVITLTTNHKLHAGESIRVLSDSGYLPDGIDSNVIYFAITNASTAETLNANQIKLARSKNDAIVGGSGNFITINNNKGGVLKIESRVSDKKPGDLAHPIQYDTTRSNWYIKASNSNTLFTQVTGNAGTIGERTGKTFIKRKEDTRSLNDKIYRLRYVIPKESLDARPPIPGYTLQESNTVGVSTSSEFTNDIPDVTTQRNLRILKSIDRDSNTGITTVVTEKPHNLIKGDQVQLRNVKSNDNPPGNINVGYNIVTDVVGITSSKGFELKFVDTSPGTQIAHGGRDQNLPVVARWKHKDTFTVYRSETIKAHDFQRQDGVYHLICVDSSISPTVNEFNTSKFNQNITDLYPQFDADNLTMDPQHAASFALNEPVGKVVTNDLRNSVTKEFTNNFIVGNRIGHAVVGATGNAGTGVVTLNVSTQHNLNTITSLTVAGSGSNYGSAGTLYNVHLSGGSGHGATGNVTVNGSGQVTAVEIVDGGSGYTKSNTLTIQAGDKNAQVTVSAINNNIGDAIQIMGVGSSKDRYNSGFNGIHTITAVTPTSVSYNSGYTADVGTYDVTTAGIHTGFFMLAGNAPNINTISYTNQSEGVVTVTTDEPHGLSVNNSFKIVGAAQTIYNGEHIVFEKNNTTQFSFKFTEPFTPATYTTTSGKAQVLPIIYGAKGGVIQEGSERLDQRQIPLTVGIHTTLSNAVLNATNSTITLTNSDGFNKGDYLQIDEEIVRVKEAFNNSNQAGVLRGQLGSRADSHAAGSVAKKIRILAVEKRRASVLRASGHTFEYLGYGPGNYSTAFPEKQDRILTREAKFLAQSTIDNGGSVVYTGVNDAGDFHIGNKVVNSQDGTEATFNIPVPTTTGSASADSDATSGRLDVIFDSAFVREGFTVDGNNNTTVRVNAPTTITEKLTVTSTSGAEFHSIDLTGGLSPARTITYAQAAPSGSGTVGDIVYTSDPSSGKYIGWVFTPAGWKRFGLISTERDLDTWVIGDPDNNGRLGIGTFLADRAGVNDDFRGALDVRGQIVADKLLMTGISTFQGTTIFEDVEIERLKVTGSNDVTGVSTFSKQVIVGAGITANELSVTGISTFTGSGTQVVMQFKPDKTATAGNVDHASSPATITVNSHGFSVGEKVQYIAGSTAIGGLTNNRAYFVVPQDANKFSLATTAANARNGTLINLSSAGAGTHTFRLLDRSADATASSLPSGVALTVDQLKVVGIATFPQQVTLNNVNIGSATFSDPSTFNGTLALNGNLTASQPVTFNNTFNANADVNLGNASSDTITMTGHVDSDIVPSGTTRDLGGSSNQWRNIFIDGTADIDELVVTEGANIQGGAVINSLKVSDLTNNRVVIAGASGEIEDSGNLTFNGSTLALTGAQTISSTLTVSGTTVLGGQLDLSGELNLMGSETHKYIDANIGTNAFHIRGTSSGDSNHVVMIRAYRAGAVELNHSGNKKLETTSGGITVTGNVTASTFTGNGQQINNLNASSITTGTISNDRLPATITSQIIGNASSADTVDVTETSTSGSQHFITYVTGAGSAAIIRTDASLKYQPSTNILTAGSFSGNGSALTSLNASNISSGTISDARLPGTITSDITGTATTADNVNIDETNTNANFQVIFSNTGQTNYQRLRIDTDDSHFFYNPNTNTLGGCNINCFTNSTLRGNGSNITSLNAAQLSSGTVPPARLGSNSGDANKFLNGNSQFVAVSVAINSLSNAGDNRVITSTGGANANAESNLTFNGTTLATPELSVSGSATISSILQSNNEIRCTGNIIAFYSDIRLKTKIEPIENAVAKLLKLSGFTYESNELAESLGYKRTGERIAGVSAQDVKEVLPEAVKPAPGNPDYMTVQYEKLVPLLIEAIKELKAEIDELKK